MQLHNNLAVIDLCKNYQDKPVLKGISFTVKSGEIIGLLGPNGAGKTTAFYSILGMVAIDAGEIRLNNLVLNHETIDKRAQLGLGYLPQEPSMFRKLTALDNVLGVLELSPLYASYSQAALKIEAQNWLDKFAIGHLSQVQAYRLSGGERRRLEIARSLSLQPKFLLLDEPFAGIDPLSIAELKHLISYLVAEHAIGVIISDHNVRDTLDICNHALIINEGRVLASGNAEHILTNQLVREVYLGKDFML